MDQPKSASRPLKIVAVLFVLGGIAAIIDVIVGLTQSAINLNFGVLGLFVGIGLLRLSRGWRTCALVFLWITMICLPLVALAFLFFAPSANYMFLWQSVGEGPGWIGVVLAAVLFAVVLWQYRVLMRPEIRQLFGPSA